MPLVSGLPDHMRSSMTIKWSDEDDAYVITVPQLPDFVTRGAAHAGAVRQGEDAIATRLQIARAWGDPNPRPRVFATTAC